MSRVQLLSRAVLLTLLVMLWLIGCSNTSPTNVPTPNNPDVNATDTPTSDPGEVIPQVNTCPVAVQMIVQNGVFLTTLGAGSINALSVFSSRKIFTHR